MSERFGAARVIVVGAARVIVVGAVLLAITTFLPAARPMAGAVLPALVASAVAGSAVGSNGLLIGEVNRAVPRRAPGWLWPCTARGR